ncbi:unnamed protein product [Closterium sp. Yama58-4]|nr:unnamed protein product [Closterium sp. Yama58-4]
MFACAASPSLPTSLHVTGSARTSHSRSRRCAPSRNHCNSSSVRATIYPRHEPSERRGGTRSSQLLGFHKSACLQGGATRIPCHPPAVARRNSPKRRASGAIRAAIDAFVIGFQGMLLKPFSDGLLEPAAEALRTTSLPFYVLASSSSSSSLSPADVSALLKRDAGVDIPEDSPRIITVAGEGEGEGKLAALLAVNSRPLAHDTANTMHYIDSDVAALTLAASQPELARWQLYHAQWSEGKEEKLHPRIRPITLKDLDELLRWGLLMGVNDGCQEYEDGTPAT